MTEFHPVLNFTQWVEEHQHLLKPPVNNKQMWERTGDFIVQVVGGPNERTDYHVDPYEEWFYQVKGDMYVNLMTDEGAKTIHIREGEMWLLPGNQPHSPQRPESGSVGIVIERVRNEGTLEKFQWYCLNCDALVHEVELQVRNIVADLPPVFEKFYDDEALRICPKCGTVHPGRIAQ
ncbi:3-hydroxyanthranilate 3,4-dioxygenase [Streptomyces sp. NBC_01669]|uniref:3-hydroxyanthranilate 3,4-dioxygenase n=1 Tax=Streptomyces sp. NBC_01669 TaxID=2975909 RepID=UPI00225992E9|nr:3-hydroxyanthranilate 3,4-dioxygenase [Streptomyces sp. NBC_01669]MCX4538239.1 3-hydroxyanthranilate 3,4-dioxygenase [Streptomyces sp. NBC_01669]